jgi:hypothetical protein
MGRWKGLPSTVKRQYVEFLIKIWEMCGIKKAISSPSGINAGSWKLEEIPYGTGLRYELRTHTYTHMVLLLSKP